MLCITKKNNIFGNKGIPGTAEEMIDIFKIERINILESGVETARIVFEIRGRHQAEKRSRCIYAIISGMRLRYD